jgi:hypothetical protein
MVKSLRFNKRGLSTIIITVILIALSLAAVVLVWGFVNNLIKKQIGSTESCFGNYDKVQINKQYTCYEDLGTGAYALRFSLAVGSVNLTKVVVSVSSASAVKSYEITNEVQQIPNMANYPCVGECWWADNLNIKLPGKNSGLTYRIIGFTSTMDLIQVAPVIGGEQCEASSLSEIESCDLLI